MDMNRRKFLGATAATGAVLAAGLALPQAGMAKPKKGNRLVKAGIITDMHHTTKADNDTRKYSTALAKMEAFTTSMKKIEPDFVVELGDFVDFLAEGTDPAKNFEEVESIFTSIKPHYHVLGNHEFDDLTRDFVLKTLTNTGIPQGQTWYSWDNNGVHFIVLDADYHPTPPHRPYDMNTPEDSFWTWKDTFIPPQELEWLKKDLAATSLPTVIFTHQTLDRTDDNSHNIKNASVVRAMLEESGKVLAVISGHDHAGGYSNIKGIHYIVMNGNVGVHDERSWKATSTKEGLDTKLDNQYALLEIFEEKNNNYRLTLKGHGRQPSYDMMRTL